MAWNWLINLTLVAVIVCQGEAQFPNNPDDVHVYVLGFMNISMDKPAMKGFQQIMISSWEDAVARIQIPYIGVDDYVSLTASNGRTHMRMIRDDLVTAKGEGARKKGVRITGTKELNIQAVKAKSATGDGFLALPITKNANEFFIMSATPTPDEHSVFLIAALYPDTCIEAYAVNGNSYRKVRGLMQLHEFDIFQMESETDDLTGVFINASRPVAVFGGHECLEEPSYTRFCDHSVAQMPPVSDWGTKYIVPPIEGRSQKAGYSIRVLSAEDNNEVRVSSTNQRRVLNRGNFLFANVTDALLTTTVTCSKPCMVAEFGRSWKYVKNDIRTDAYMTLIPPVDRYVRRASFGTAKFYDKEYQQDFDFQKNYVTIVARNSPLNDIVLDGKVVSGNWRQVDSVTSITNVEIGIGFHSLGMSGSSTGTLMGFAYGHAIQVPTAYGFPLGYKLNGELVHPRWQQQVVTDSPVAPDVTVIPRECVINTDSTRAPDLTYYLRIDLKHKAGQGCATKYMRVLGERIAILKDYVNKLICNGVICPGLTGTAVKSLARKWVDQGIYVTGIDIDVIMSTSIDDRIGDMYMCRRSILHAIGSATLWHLPEPIAGCPVLDFASVYPRSGPGGVAGGQMKWQNCH